MDLFALGVLDFGLSPFDLDFLSFSFSLEDDCFFATSLGLLENSLREVLGLAADFLVSAFKRFSDEVRLERLVERSRERLRLVEEEMLPVCLFEDDSFPLSFDFGSSAERLSRLRLRLDRSFFSSLFVFTGGFLGGSSGVDSDSLGLLMATASWRY